MNPRWDDNQPIYWQLREKTITAILDGTLDEGKPLPSVRQVAVDFQVNPLTVSRAYQSLVDDVRQQLARRLLQETEFSLVEVAFMTGFSGQSAFTRAFKRWAGQTPRSYRLQAQGITPPS